MEEEDSPCEGGGKELESGLQVAEREAGLLSPTVSSAPPSVP